MRFFDSEALSAGTGANGLEVDLNGIIDLVACHSVELVNDESETYERTAGMSFLAMRWTNNMDPSTEVYAENKEDATVSRIFRSKENILVISDWFVERWMKTPM
ncbi:hypothetical protein TB2_018035 [Malus domestica]